MLAFTSVAGGAPFVAPLSFAWEFGGARPPSAAPSAGRVVFAEAGTFEVTLTVTDGSGEQSVERRTVEVLPGPP